MKINKTAGERGFLRLILIIIILLLIVSYFGINLRQVVNSPTTQDNVSYVWDGAMTVWNNYLKVPATALWNFFISYVWNIAIDSLKSGSIHMPSLSGSTTPMFGGQ
jgi:phosphatidylglycerophosphatase A